MIGLEYFMSIKRPQLVNNEIYHIVTRAIEELKLFLGQKDYLRMIHDLFEFNDENPVISTYRKPRRINGTRTVLVPLKVKKKRKMLVEILAFCLMPNHVHLLVRQLREGGISKFMRKIGAGYVNYYNQKYKRGGHLFRGRYRIIHIKTQEQLKTIFVYIHTNPVAIMIPSWKENGISGQKLQEVLKFLENYRWSSYPDYLGKKNFPSLTSRDFLIKIMGSVKDCQEFVKGWLQFKKEIKETATLKEIKID